NPRTSCEGARKFFSPLMTNSPVGTIPPGPILATWLASTQYADIIALDSQALDVAVQRLPAWERVLGGIGAFPAPGLFFTIIGVAPWRSACTKTSPFLRCLR